MKRFLSNFRYWVSRGYSIRRAWDLAGRTF
jgi:hypothetical protein